MIEAKAFRTFITVYPLFKSEPLSANIKLTLHKALISSVMTYASPAWESAEDTHLLKLQRLQNKVHVFISPRNRVARLYPQGLGLWMSILFDRVKRSG
jgi:hypothetical protein